MAEQCPNLSVVVPCYNEEQNLFAFAEELACAVAEIMQEGGGEL